ncbi:MAG: DAK2 domain-containing protein [Erysipelotrichaceae bacterium]|nr:DAK2 domain-containing protein [Erysipelotrichaceae bacterium]
MRTLIDGPTLLNMLRSGQANLANHQKEINALNVFPVPDGDTGTNMSMTFTNGLKEAEAVRSTSVADIAKALSKGLLMGARGNSGVITSQIFRGFSQSIQGKESITAMEAATAFENGARVAYKAIMKPVEGTILTVIREGSWYAKHYLEEHPDLSVEEYFEKLVEFSRESLATTPDLLPVLKEVGVVDSGGSGLCTIFEGFLGSLKDRPYELQEEDTLSYEEHIAALDLANDEFGYCTEFILRLDEEIRDTFDEEVLKQKLTMMGGNSLVCARDGELVKIHVHTLKPGEALNIGQRYGEFIKLKIENMQEQHRVLEEQQAARKAAEAKPQEKKTYAIITVAAGKGLHEVFKECRADVIINGGQTMNPSTEDFDKEIRKLNAEHIFILPNNSNIIMAAQAAQSVNEDLDIHILPTRSIPEGITALSMFNPEGSVEENIAEMEEAMRNVQSGSLTYAVKDTSLNGVKVTEGDFIGMTNKQIISSGRDKMKVVKELLNEMFKKEDAELITIIAGEDSTPEETEEIRSYVEENSELEVEVLQGDQPVYAYLFGIE